jgi:N-acyl-D-glucosamine 2-epimerase
MKQTSDLLYQEYRHMLVDNILPFWLRYGLDRVHGGMYTALDRDGSILDTDKSVWFQGRALWTYATAYRQVEKNSGYKGACDSLVSFIEANCFDPSDGRMYFRVSKEGSR